MPAELIDGRAIAKKVRDEVAVRAKALTRKGIKPGLAVVLVGEDPASVVYTSSKAKAAEEAGMFSLNIKGKKEEPADLERDVGAPWDGVGADQD